MATVDTSGDPITITYSLPAAQAAAFKQAIVEIFDMDPGSTNVQVADRIALDLRERIRRDRRRQAQVAAVEADPGTVDFT